MLNLRIISRYLTKRTLTLYPVLNKMPLKTIPVIPFNKCYLSSSITSSSGLVDTAGNASSGEYGGVQIDAIAEGDKEIEKLLRILILEVDIFRQDGAMVPEVIKNEHWRELLQLKSRASRLRYLTFLFKNEKRKENEKKRIEERKMERETKDKIADDTGHIKYGFSGSTIFLRVYDSTMDSYFNKNLMNATMFSQHIVLDCSYDDHMNRIEARNCAKQICMLFSDNRTHKEPFHIQLCNINPESMLMQSLHKYIPPMYNDDFPMFVTEKSYLDLYPKEKIVYLTPHCKNDVIEWNHDDIYVIGAIVDKTDPKPLSLAKAKQLNLRMAKLPLERHLIWGSGAGKCLTLNQMVNIMLDVRHDGNWEKAFRHIPRRKIVTEEDLASETRRNKFTHRQPIDRTPIRPGEVNLSQNMLKRIGGKKVDYVKLFDD